MIWKSLIGRKRTASPHRRVYETIVAHARQPWLYAEAGVPDTMMGRFDMIVLHAVAVLDRLRGEGEAADAFAQELTDEMFRDLDRSLREMGVGDLSVGKRMRKLAESFLGRANAYRKAFAATGEDRDRDVAGVIGRNVFPDGSGDADVTRLAAHAIGFRQRLAGQAVSAIVAGDLGQP